MHGGHWRLRKKNRMAFLMHRTFLRPIAYARARLMQPWPRHDLQASRAFFKARADIGSRQRSRIARLAGRAGLHRGLPAGVLPAPCFLRAKSARSLAIRPVTACQEFSDMAGSQTQSRAPEAMQSSLCLISIKRQTDSFVL